MWRFSSANQRLQTAGGKLLSGHGDRMTSCGCESKALNQRPSQTDTAQTVSVLEPTRSDLHALL